MAKEKQQRHKYTVKESVLVEGEVVAVMRAGIVVRFKNHPVNKAICVFVPHEIVKKRRLVRSKDILPEYDFSKGTRGKYAARYHAPGKE
jgi:hypothetical protein